MFVAVLLLCQTRHHVDGPFAHGTVPVAECSLPLADAVTSRGRLEPASEWKPDTYFAAFTRRGKHRPTYTPSVDMGGFVVVVNAEKVIVTGSKASQKLYKRHTTGRPGSMKEETFGQLQAVRGRCHVLLCWVKRSGCR